MPARAGACELGDHGGTDLDPGRVRRRAGALGRCGLQPADLAGHKTRVTKGAAVAYTTWVKRAEAHPLVAGRLAAGEISESVARTLCLWTDKLPEDRREEADKILTDAAVSGLGLAYLAGLFAEMYERSRAEEPDRDKEESFEDRALRLVTTLGGAGVLHGDLTPECAAAKAVLDALSAPVDAEDTRTQEQRCHDALGEAMRRLDFCMMVGPWTTHRQTGRKPSSGRVRTPA